jgi:hypothetical protein
MHGRYGNWLATRDVGEQAEGSAGAWRSGARRLPVGVVALRLDPVDIGANESLASELTSFEQPGAVATTEQHGTARASWRLTAMSQSVVRQTRSAIHHRVAHTLDVNTQRRRRLSAASGPGRHVEPRR